MGGYWHKAWGLFRKSFNTSIAAFAVADLALLVLLVLYLQLLSSVVTNDPAAVFAQTHKLEDITAQNANELIPDSLVTDTYVLLGKMALLIFGGAVFFFFALLLSRVASWSYVLKKKTLLAHKKTYAFTLIIWLGVWCIPGVLLLCGYTLIAALITTSFQNSLWAVVPLYVGLFYLFLWLLHISFVMDKVAFEKNSAFEGLKASYTQGAAVFHKHALWFLGMLTILAIISSLLRTYVLEEGTLLLSIMSCLSILYVAWMRSYVVVEK